MIELNKIYNEDCLEGMKRIPDNSVDLIVTDPPFKLNKTTGSMTSSSKQDRWQGNLKAGDKKANIHNDIKFKDWLLEVYRLLKPQSHFYTFVNDKNVQDMLNEASKVGFKLHNILVWHKNNKTPNRWYMKDCEFVLFFHKGKSFPINELGSSQCLDYGYEGLDFEKEDMLWEEQVLEVQNINGKNKLHPTQKPVELLNKIILNSSKENDIILDPFIGSGTTAIAAINTNRNFIGFEIDKHYCEIANERIRKALAERVVSE